MSVDHHNNTVNNAINEPTESSTELGDASPVIPVATPPLSPTSPEISTTNTPNASADNSDYALSNMFAENVSDEDWFDNANSNPAVIAEPAADVPDNSDDNTNNTALPAVPLLIPSLYHLSHSLTARISKCQIPAFPMTSHPHPQSFLPHSNRQHIIYQYIFQSRMCPKMYQ